MNVSLQSHLSSIPMTEVPSKPQRRRFTAAYKKKILAEVAACTGRGEVGALLRREGIYSSHIAAWRTALERSDTASLEPKRRGPKPNPSRAAEKEAEQLRRQVARLERKLEQAQGIIEIQKKVAALLGNPIPDDNGSS